MGVVRGDTLLWNIIIFIITLTTTTYRVDILPNVDKRSPYSVLKAKSLAWIQG